MIGSSLFELYFILVYEYEARFRWFVPSGKTILFQPNIRGGIIRGSFLKHDLFLGRGGGGEMT